jgi:hypothetical protein
LGFDPHIEASFEKTVAGRANFPAIFFRETRSALGQKRTFNGANGAKTGNRWQVLSQSNQ